MGVEFFSESFFFSSGQGGRAARLFAQVFLPASAPRAVVQVAHGMRESTGYYREFCEFLTARGFAVAIHDARGHGRTAGPVGSEEFRCNAGVLGDDGMRRMAEDLAVFRDLLKQKFPGRPVFLMGHSMGSVVARLAAATDGAAWDGLLLSGTSGPWEEERLAYLLGCARYEAVHLGWGAPATRTPALLFAHFNDRFAPAVTGSEYMSRDIAMVHEAMSSPDTDIRYTCGFYVSFLEALREAGSASSIRKIPKNVPVLLLAGDMDPFGDDGEGVKQLTSLYRAAGIRDVACMLYKGGRHEMLREINRRDVFGDVFGWLAERLPNAADSAAGG